MRDISELPAYLRKPRLRRFEVPEYLRLVYGIERSAATLAKYASIGGGPDYNKEGSTPLYPREALDRWAQEKLGKLVNSTSEYDSRGAKTGAGRRNAA